MMSSNHEVEPVRVGVLTNEPLRAEGLASIFEIRASAGSAPLSPVIGNLEELLSDSKLGFLVVDLHSHDSGVGTLEAVRRRRPDLRLIVIGPEGNEKLIMDLIMAGARAYLDSKASPQTVRMAIEVVTSGSIWAPRRLLSKLIDRLLMASDRSLTQAHPRLTDRERQVLELILTASSNREIGRQLGIEERTVQAHVGRLLRKTGASNRIDLSLRALNRSLLSAAGSNERRRSDRRVSDRRQTAAPGPRPADQ